MPAPKSTEGNAVTATLQNVLVVSADPEETAAFYAKVLGLGQRFADPGKWVQLSDGSRNFAVASRAEADGLAPGHACVIFEVPDLAIAAHLVAFNGGTVTGTRDMGSHGRIALCTDPDGTPFRLFARV